MLSGAVDLKEIHLPFWKVEGIGNDFVLVHLEDVERLRGDLPVDEILKNLAIKICQRRFSIGSDGLLAVRMEGQTILYRMFNPDGTEDFCGNGLRCVARHAHNQGWVGNEFVIRHRDLLVPTQIKGNLISTEIGTASYDPAKIPVRFVKSPEQTFGRLPIWQGLGLSVGGSALTTGSTHVVIMGEGTIVNDELFIMASPEIENDPQFPERTSVIWAEIVAPEKLKIRIWERGAGETQGCGTGSAAAAIEYMRRQNLSGTIQVQNPGGIVKVTAASWNSPITVSGEAIEIFSGEVRVSLK
jgi:diaminopimelate epimerase